MADKTALQTRLEEVMEALTWTRADIERYSGASRSLVAQWFGKAERPVQTLGVLPAVKLQDASGYSALWLALGEGPKKIPSTGAIDSQSAELMRIYARLDVIGRARLLAFAADSLKVGRVDVDNAMGAATNVARLPASTEAKTGLQKTAEQKQLGARATRPRVPRAKP